MASPRFGVVGPVALFQHDDTYPRFGESLSGDGTGRSGANNERVGGVITGGHALVSSSYNTRTMWLPRYDTGQTYRWNFDRAPEPPAGIEVPQIGGHWTYCGRPISSPMAIAAGPLLNGRWILYYAALGFDVLTYKTVRSRPRDCYPLPNLQPVETAALAASGRDLEATGHMRGSWAVSFGMPSMSTDVWRADV